MSIYGVRVFRCRPAGGLSSSPAARPSEGLVSMSIYGVRALSRPAGGLSYSPAACPSTQRCAASQHAGACAYWARGQTSPWMLRMRAAVPGSSPGSPALMRNCVHMNKFLSLSLSLSHTHTHTHTSLAHHAEWFATRCLLLDRRYDVPSYSRACGKLPRISCCWVVQM